MKKNDSPGFYNTKYQLENRLIASVAWYIKEFKRFFKGYKYLIWRIRNICMLRMNTTGRVWNIGVEFLLGTENKNLHEDMRVHLREYLVTFNQNTFYTFVYLGKALSLFFFLVPDFNSCFKIIDFSFLVWKWRWRSHYLVYVPVFVCVDYLLVCLGKILL